MHFLIDPTHHNKVNYIQLISDLTGGNIQPPMDRPIDRLYRRLLEILRQFYRQLSAVELTPQPTCQTSQSTDLLSQELFEKVFSAKCDESDITSLLARWRDRFLKSDRQIMIETSGSSGQPKRIAHSIQSLTQGVKLDAKHRTDIWGLTYPIDHLAGLQVLFQATLNLNPLVNLYGLPSPTVHQALEDYQITHLSCTPTFLRLLTAEKLIHPSVVRITCGGERLDGTLAQAARKIFPNAKLTNIYAATETGTLLVSHNDQFVVPKALIPKIMIANGELLLHRSLRLDTHLERNRNESLFFDPNSPASESLEAFWNTGDLVEVVSDDPLTICFVGRKHEWFNVAGFRVDPGKLEALASTHPAVAQARFFGVPNSVTENLVACELVLDRSVDHFDLESWKGEFSKQVEKHEIPRWVTIVDRPATTESGKIKRE